MTSSTDTAHEARSRRHAKKELLRSLDAVVKHGLAPSQSPRFQVAVAALIAGGYSFDDIHRATNGSVSLAELTNAVRHLLTRELAELLPLSRSTNKWPNRQVH